jgi:hypothetical protein
VFSLSLSFHSCLQAHNQAEFIRLISYFISSAWQSMLTSITPYTITLCVFLNCCCGGPLITVLLDVHHSNTIAYLCYTDKLLVRRRLNTQHSLRRREALAACSSGFVEHAHSQPLPKFHGSVTLRPMLSTYAQEVVMYIANTPIIRAQHDSDPATCCSTHRSLQSS